jgi:hypothetical protein
MESSRFEAAGYRLLFAEVWVSMCILYAIAVYFLVGHDGYAKGWAAVVVLGPAFLSLGPLLVASWRITIWLSR